MGSLTVIHADMMRERPRALHDAAPLLNTKPTFLIAQAGRPSRTWLGDRDSNPKLLIQSQMFYR